jgi:DNA-binding transcriptional LysR family regulator
MVMQIDHIILFNEIAKEKSISRVAANSHISQPALSQQMQRLEDEIGLKLFVRSNKGIELTEAGQILQKYATQIIHTYNNFKEDIADYQNNSRTFRICATNVVANYALPCTFYKVNQKFPNYTFHMNSMPSKEVVRKVTENQADLGFIVGTTDESSVISKYAYSDKIIIVANKNYNIPDKITFQELKRYPLIMLNETFSSCRIVVQYFEELGYHLMDDYKILYQMDSTESVKASVIGKYGLAFLPYMAVKKELYLNQLKSVHIDGFELDYNITMIHKPKEELINPDMFHVIKYFENTINKSIC